MFSVLCGYIVNIPANCVPDIVFGSTVTKYFDGIYIGSFVGNKFDKISIFL